MRDYAGNSTEGEFAKKKKRERESTRNRLTYGDKKMVAENLAPVSQ